MCGLAHSTFVTTPVTSTGVDWSNCAASEWCATAAVPVSNSAAPVMQQIANLPFIAKLLACII
jgi:hypothetical protein